jgi:hypothetical protein
MDTLPSDLGGPEQWAPTTAKDIRGATTRYNKSQFFDNPLNELARSSPSEVISRYSISAVNTGSTHVALGFLSGLLNLLFGLATVSRAVLDRLVHNAHRLTLKGDSMRKITAQRANLDAAKKT